MEELKAQLLEVDGEKWSYMIHLKLAELSGGDDGIQAFEKIEEAIVPQPVILQIYDTVTERFSELRDEIDDDSPAAVDTDAIEENGEEELTEEDFERYEAIYRTGVLLASLSLAVLAEPEENFSPLSHAVSRPDIVAEALEELYDEDRVESVLEVFCDEAFGKQSIGLRTAWQIEYAGLFDMTHAIGACAAQNLDNVLESTMAHAAVSTTYAAFLRVFEAELFQQEFSRQLN